MKKALGVGVVVFFVFFLALAGCAPEEEPEVVDEEPEVVDEEPEEVDEEFTFRISAGLSPEHFWVGYHMDPFADRIEEESGSAIKFERFYAAELVDVGRELDALGRSIDVAAPLLAPYHEGLFPLSDITQLPAVDTDSETVTRAHQRLMDSDVELQDGMTFYEYEIERRDIKAWPLGVTGPYVLSTSDKEDLLLESPDDLRGMPLRAGSALHTMVIEAFGATPVTMPTAESYEALSRGTLEGMILSVGDWVSYGLEDQLEYTIVGINAGHWGSYLAMLKEDFYAMPTDMQEMWDQVGRDMAIENARYIDERDLSELERIEEEYGAVFQDVSELSPEMQDHLNEAMTRTWERWIDTLEDEGHPGRAVAELYMELLIEEGGNVPDGVEDLF